MWTVEELKALVPLLLGYAIVAGSCILKLPQVIKILKAGNADGVSLSAQLIDALGFTVTATWGYKMKLSFGDWGESAIVIAQLYILILLIGSLQKGAKRTAMIYLGVLGAVTGLLLSEWVSTDVHRMIMNGNILFGVASRFPQIYQNYRAKNTGQVAMLGFFLAVGGNGARMFTSAMRVPWESGKLQMMLQAAVMVVLNGVIMVQCLYYGGAPSSSSSASVATTTTTATAAAKETSSPKKDTKKAK